VKRGDQTWEVVGDDPESLKKLPEDLRPVVQRMLRGGMAFGTGDQVPNVQVPGMDWNFQGRGFDDGRLRERLDQMERRMNQLLERLDRDNRPAGEPKAEQEEAK
jgi:hypothetical protein